MLWILFFEKHPHLEKTIMNVSEIVGRHGNNRENLLQILHDLQDSSGDNSLHRDALEELAKIMDIPASTVLYTWLLINAGPPETSTYKD